MNNHTPCPSVIKFDLEKEAMDSFCFIVKICNDDLKYIIQPWKNVCIITTCHHIPFFTLCKFSVSHVKYLSFST